MRTQHLLAFVFLCCSSLPACKEKPRGKASENCRQDDDCDSGLICVSGLFSTPRCYQQCGERGYGGCRNGWQCGAKAWTVGGGNQPSDARKVCVPDSFKIAPPEPEGWWTERAVSERDRDIDALTRSVFHFHKEGYDIFLPDGRFDRRFMVWMETPAGYKGAGFQDLRIIDTDAGYQLRSARDLIQLVPLEEDRVASLQKLLDEAPKLRKVCEEALACCRDASEKLKMGCPRKSVMHGENSLQVCLDVFPYFIEKLAEDKQEIPDSCQRAAAKAPRTDPPG